MSCPLPNELILQILSEVTARDDLCCVRLASRSFSELSASSLFTILKIGVAFGLHPNCDTPSMQFLRAIAKRQTALGQHVRNIHLALPLEHHSAPSTSSGVKQRFQAMLHRLGATRRRHSHELTIEMLHLAVPLLSRLSHIRLENISPPCHPSCSRVDEHTRRLNQLLLRLSHIPKLRSASFFTRPDRRGLSFTSFTNLRKLDIEWDMKHSDGLSRMISCNRHLEDLTVAIDWWMDDSLVSSPPVRLDDVLPSHLRQLNRLKLLNVDVPPDSLSGNALKSLSQLQHLSLRWMAPSDEFWVALGLTNTRLLSLSLSDVPVTDAAIDYLAICTALTSIRILSGRDEYDCEAGRSFWIRILPIHALRIVDLAITGPGQWSLHDEDIDTLPRCSALEHLCVHVSESDVSVEGETNVVRCLLQFVFGEAWPRMSTLSILSVAGEIVPGFRTRLEQHRINRIIEDARFEDNSAVICDRVFGLRIHSIGRWYRICRLSGELRFVRTSAVVEWT